MDEVAQVRKELDDKVPTLEGVLASGREILSKCHPNAEQNMKYWLKILQGRWDEVSQIADTKRVDLEKVVISLVSLVEFCSLFLLSSITIKPLQGELQNFFSRLLGRIHVNYGLIA